MDTITLRFYQRTADIPAHTTLEAAQTAEPTTDYGYGVREYGFAVLFQIGALYGVYVHNEDRYYSDYLPDDARVLYTGRWRKGEPVEWKVSGRQSKEEIDMLASAGAANLIDLRSLLAAIDEQRQRDNANPPPR